MTVPTTVVSSPAYPGNDAAAAFATSFMFLDLGQVVPVLIEGDVETDLTTGFTVTGLGVTTGGTVTLDTPLATGKSLRIDRRTALTQPESVRNLGSFAPKIHEQAWNRLLMQIQEVGAGTLRVPRSALSGFDGLLPAPGPLMPLVGKADGSGYENGDTTLTGDMLLRPNLAADAGTTLVGFVQAGSGAVGRTLQGKVRETVSITDFGAVMDDATDDFPAIFAAINSGARHVIVPPGTSYCSFTLSLPAGVKLEGMGSTLRFPQGVNGVNIAGVGSSLHNIILDGTAVDDVLGASGVILYSDGAAVNVTCNNWGFHGFATANGVGAHRNALVGCRAFNTGHRGINLSNGSTYNRVTNFSARNCKRAGIILGYKTNYNVFSDIYIEGHSVSAGGAGLWVHMNSDYNVFTNVVIGPQDGTGTTAPSVILAAGCQGNSFNNMKLRAVGTRGILVWNLAVDHPELGTADAPLQENRFNDVDILGTGLASSAGVVIQSDDSLFVVNNQFDRFYINGFTDGVYDNDSLSSGCEFRNFRFGASITSRKMRVGNSADQYRTGRRINCQGLTGIGSLASAMTEYDTQPTIAATTVAVTQPYPFPVMIFIAGLAGTTQVQINGVNVNGTLHDLGNGTYILQPGQTITLNYTSGTPNWRWFGL